MGSMDWDTDIRIAIYYYYLPFFHFCISKQKRNDKIFQVGIRCKLNVNVIILYYMYVIAIINEIKYAWEIISLQFN